jgi:hypothetical protein
MARWINVLELTPASAESASQLWNSVVMQGLWHGLAFGERRIVEAFLLVEIKGGISQQSLKAIRKDPRIGGMDIHLGVTIEEMRTRLHCVRRIAA